MQKGDLGRALVAASHRFLVEFVVVFNICVFEHDSHTLFQPVHGVIALQEREFLCVVRLVPLLAVREGTAVVDAHLVKLAQLQPGDRALFSRLWGGTGWQMR